MSDAASHTAWVDTNQRYLVAEFARLKVRLAGEQPAAPTERVEATSGGQPMLAAIDLLAERFGLSRFERDILLLCAAVEMNGDMARLCGEAQRSAGRAHLTFGLALAALEEAHWSAVTPIAPLRRWRFIEVDEQMGLANGKLRIDERVLHYIAGVNYLDPRLRPLCRLRQPGRTMAESHKQAVTQMLAMMDQRTALPVVAFSGDDHEGQGDVAAVVAEELRVQLYELPAALLPSNPAEVEALAVLWQREAILLNAALLLDCGERDMPKQTASFVDQLSGLVFLTGQDRPTVRRQVYSVTVGKPSAREQRVLWEEALGRTAAQMNGSLDAAASQFRLSAQTIQKTAREVSEAMERGEPTDRLLWRTCRGAVRSKLDELAQRIEPAAGWDALVLPAPQRATLRQIAAHVRHRLAVYHDWGFADRGTRGLGIAALFTGESGTGKTMAAEVLANELHLDLYRIDLSSVVSKYIGETEKNLRRVFDAAEDSGAVLLFDEADALFGKRSEVKDSHDRYANIEVSYLLQRMEAYRGLAILTTNMKASLDSAFLRRLRFVVQFPFPDTAQREAIWRTIFPSATPTEGLDYPKLARAHMPGGNIKNIALNAAFLAAEAKEPVRMRHLLQAAQSEAAKRERPLADAETKGWV
jgi:hypothetical protein